MKKWEELTLPEQAAMMKVAVQNGIYNLHDIRQKYNEFAEGGDTDTDWSYDNWKRLISEHMGIRPDEDNTYDYEAYFKKYPEEAWKMLKGDPTAHFSDEFKTVYHPTFSSKSIGNDGSIYSGVRNPKTNPQGLVGGTWSPDYHTFTMSPDGYRGPVSMDDRKWYLENAEDNGVQLREADGSLPIYDGIPWGGVLPNVTVYGNKHAEGGNLFGGGGYTSSDAIRKRITEFEGTAMTGAKDPLSGKYGTNRSFEAEDKSFYNALPESIREQVLSNPQLADNLYSYSYNVGAGNFRKRVVPTLEKYYQGQATIKDIEDSMWASGDKKLRGLRRRRSVEREGVRNALLPTLTQYEALPVSTQVFTPFPLIQQNTHQLPVMEPDTDSYITAHQVTPAEQRRQKLRESIEATQRFNNLMNLFGIQNTALPAFMPQTENTFLNTLSILNHKAEGGSIHIKPSHRGRLTALKERTGHSATWFKEHGTPSEKRMATFAINAAKWKHGDGGNLYDIGGKVVTTGGAGYIPPAINLPTKQEVRKRLYENLNPYDYGNAITRVAKAVIGNTKEDVLSEGVYMPEVDDLWAEYLQIPQSQRHSGSKLVNEGHHTKVLPAVYKPTKSSGSGKYYRLDLNESSKKAIVDEAMGNTYEEGFDISPNPYNNHLGIKRIEKNPLSIGENRVATSYDKTLNRALRDFTVGRGRDNKGEYVSYYDLWDLSPYRISNKDQSFGIGKPFEIYDRIYLDDYYGVPKESRGGNYLPEIVVTGKRKHGLGGNLYDGETQPTQQMQVGRKMGAPYYDYSVEGHPITRNAVEPLQEIIVIGKKPKSWFERVGDAVKDTDVAYIENPAVMTAAGHTAKISQAHKPTKEERRLGDNLAIIGAAGAAVESAPAVASALAPGSSFWMNPITQQIAKSTLGGTAFDAASTVITGSTIGGNVRDFIGYQPSNEWTRLGYNLATDMFNPGYSYGSVRLGWDLLPSPLIPKRGSMQMNHGRNFGEFNPDTWNNWGSESLTLLGNKYAVKVPKTTRTSEDVGPKVFDDMGWRYRAFINSKLAANKIPGFEPYEYIGFHTIKGGYTPVFRQKKLIQKGTQTPEDIKFNEEALADVENAMSKSSGLWKSWNVGDYNLGHNIGKNAEGIGKLFDATYSREPITWFMQNFPRKWEVSPTNNTRILNSILKNYDNE